MIVKIVKRVCVVAAVSFVGLGCTSTDEGQGDLEVIEVSKSELSDDPLMVEADEFTDAEIQEQVEAEVQEDIANDPDLSEEIVDEELTAEESAFEDAGYAAINDEEAGVDSQEDLLADEGAPTKVADATDVKVTAMEGGSNSYVIKKGDTLSSIAQSELGSAYKWQKLADLNGLSNPHLIYPGTKIVLR